MGGPRRTGQTARPGVQDRDQDLALGAVQGPDRLGSPCAPGTASPPHSLLQERPGGKINVDRTDFPSQAASVGLRYRPPAGLEPVAPKHFSRVSCSHSCWLRAVEFLGTVLREKRVLALRADAGGS